MVKCQVCVQARADLECSECGGLKTCFPCGRFRHKFGRLGSHSVRFIFPKPAHYGGGSSSSGGVGRRIGSSSGRGSGSNSNSSSSNGGGGEVEKRRIGVDKCEFCSTLKSDLVCRECDVMFCVPCCKEFHDNGGPAFAKHQEHYEYSSVKVEAPKRPPRLDSSKLQSLLASDANGGAGAASSASAAATTATALSSSMDRSPSASPGLLPTSARTLSARRKTEINATYRLAAYGLGISDSQLLLDATKENPALNFFISTEYDRHQITVFARAVKDKSLALSHTRAFHSIKQVVHDRLDRRHFSIYFNDSKPVAQCLAMNESEGTQIQQRLYQIVQHEQLSMMLKGIGQQDNALFSGYAFKKGKMSWGKRWLVIKRQRMELFRNKQGVVPVHSVPVTRAADVYPSASSKKQLIVVAPTRQYVLKMDSMATRDTVVSLLHKASQMTTPQPSPRIPSLADDSDDEQQLQTDDDEHDIKLQQQQPQQPQQQQRAECRSLRRRAQTLERVGTVRDAVATTLPLESTKQVRQRAVRPLLRQRRVRERRLLQAHGRDLRLYRRQHRAHVCVLLRVQEDRWLQLSGQSQGIEVEAAVVLQPPHQDGPTRALQLDAPVEQRRRRHRKCAAHQHVWQQR
eukprot:TRINITY_DN68148_c1_g1_i3.p1 TRINITY_DN68148_c1_g1~~TRINITY_DN68148_c1_g1_i3.p1  ORF type:complete len:628 (-),score=249.09 TRINITY_DN68148_c1_g1_i3:756-2639(-)